MILKELLRVVEEIKKDLAYTQRLEERWVSEQKRFPLIYKYIIKQREFFEEQIERALTMKLDDSQLDSYVAGRPGVKIDRIKTAQVTPPREEADEPLTEAPKPVAPTIEKPKTKPPVPVKEEPAAKAKPEIERKPVTDEETKDAKKALEEAAAAAALKLRQQAPEPVTQSVAAEKAGVKDEEPAPEPAGETERPADQKLSSKEKLRRLASEVLNEVKRSKTE